MKNSIRILFILLFISPILFGCGRVDEKTVDHIVKEINEKEINTIIDAMPETQSIIPLTDEFRAEQRMYNLEKYKDNAEKATGFKIREYKDYWILENAEEGFGLRLPYDTSFYSDKGNFGYLAIFHSRNKEDKELSCNSEVYITKNMSFDEWQKENEEKYKDFMFEDRTTKDHQNKKMGNVTIFTETIESKFGKTGGLTIATNKNIYDIGTSGIDDECKNAYESLVQSIFTF